MRWMWVRLASIIAAGATVQAAVALLPPRGGLVLDNALIAAVAGYAAIGFAGQAAQTRRRLRAAWTLAAVSVGLWCAANTVDAVHALFGLGEPPWAIDSWLSVAAAVLAPLALTFVAPRPATATVRLRRWIDVATVSGALLLIAWQFVLGPVYQALGSAGPLFMLVLTPEIVGAAFAIVLLSRGSTRTSGTALRLFAASLTVMAGTVLVSVHVAVTDRPWHNSGTTAGYLIAALLSALASRAPAPADEVTDVEDGADRWALLPYLPVVVAFAIVAWLLLHTGTVGPVVVWMLLATFASVMLRQFLTVRTNTGLMRDLQQQQLRLAHQATHDSLTGLLNRAAFTDRATAALTAAGPDDVTAVLIVDLDGFKTVNDTFGHAAGDQLLIGVADRLRTSVRSEDVVARLGGDEFVLLLTERREEADADLVGARILRHLAPPMTVAGTALPVRGSIGAVAVQGSAHRLDQLLHEADMALYQAKADGKGVVRRHGEPLRHAAAP